MILVGRGLSRRPRLWTKGLPPGCRVMLVSEPGVWRLHGAPVAAALRRAGFRTGIHILPRGEKAKTWPAVERLLRAMLEAGLGRDSALLALGGGSVTDAAGFAAAVYMRGIPWVSLPTTLLGQVDSGIGGKTAIDLPEGKNLVGAFHQPRAVVCDTAWLDTLPARELRSGLGEVLKYGLLFDPALRAPLRKGRLERVIRRCAALKARLVAQDERETKGRREVLNFGHTIGHALETAASGRLRHGEAVVCGMRAALRLSQARAGELESFLKTFPLPRLRLRESAVMENLRRDKKARRGRLRFVLLKAVGQPVVSDRVREASVREAVRFILGELR
ncbi:MAG: 3-dehydroquinate synthase [Elusimicrobia bacterium]|nr:3-dehydroquinate synthase [Elusimicrobiota bacterium]